MKRITTYIGIGLGLGALAAGCSTLEDEQGAPSPAPSFSSEDIELALPAGAEVAALKQRIVAGQQLTFVKYMDQAGDFAELVLDADGKRVEASELPRPAPRPIGRALRRVLDSQPGDPQFRQDDEEIDVVIALRETEAPDELDVPAEQGIAIVDETGRATVAINDTLAADDELRTRMLDKQARIDTRLNRLASSRRATLHELAARHPAFSAHPALAEAIERGASSVTLPINKAGIEELLQSDGDIIAGLDLYSPPADDLSTAMQDTNVDPWALNYSARRGNGIGVYMSEGGCPDTSHITNYMRLSGSSSSHSRNVSAIVRGVSPSSYVYCRSGYTLPTAADLTGHSGNPRVHIETHSWGYSTSDNEDYRTWDRDFDNHVYDTAVSVFKSNGNNGNNNGYGSSPGKALNLISVGNYDDSIDTIRSSSSFKDSEIGNNKPELSAPGTGICAGGVCMTGTSQASPHAAGFAADLMGAYNWLQLKPYYIKAFMLAGADKSVSGGSDKVGVGGLNFYRAYYNNTNSWWEGGNNSFSYFDSTDYLPNNGYIDRQVYISSYRSNVRIALSWLNRGSYIYDHRSDSHPIGMDLDLCVYDPNGAFKGCSSSWDNPYELVSFDPTVSGYYRVRISRYANRDTGSKLHMGLAINWN